MRNKPKNIVVIYKGDDWNKKIPMKSGDTRKSFENWHERGLKYNIAMYRASLKWYNIEKNCFTKVWAYRNKEWIKIKKAIKPDLIFDKVMSKRDYELFEWKIKVSKNVKIYNSPIFRTLVDNKLSQYLFLKEFMAKSYLAENKKELLRALELIKSKKIVLKPLYGSGGFGIKICQAKDARNKRLDYPILVQEFIETIGIPNFSNKEEISDLRLVYVNHKLIYALSRIAKNGSYFTNFHQGAKAVLVKNKEIPHRVITTSKKIVNQLRIFPGANYSLDFIFSKSGKPYLIEMNTTPGFDLLEIVGDESIKKKYFEEFIKVIG